MYELHTYCESKYVLTVGFMEFKPLIIRVEGLLHVSVIENMQILVDLIEKLYLTLPIDIS